MGGSDFHHVFRLRSDHVHITRDDPNVPSGLEQMQQLDDSQRFAHLG
ncbi:hypothetical protein [Kitasatospora sp. McL0602]